MSTRVLRWQVQHWRLYAGVVAGGIFGYILFGAVLFQALAAIGFMAFAVFAAVTVCAVRKAAVAAKRPDYPAIARMEREVWGETFRHEGGLKRPVTVRVPGCTHPDTAELRTTTDRVCWICTGCGERLPADYYITLAEQDLLGALEGMYQQLGPPPGWKGEQR